MTDIVEEIVKLLEEQGNGLYFGEAISEKEHALQSAHLAELAGESSAVIVAALLHDIGHLLHGLPEEIAAKGIDGHHEEVGEVWLAKWFGPEITEPVHLHVDAKRYLCATETGYLRSLSPSSRQSLELQGGVFTSGEIADFEKNPYFREAVRLRKYDDAAKVVGLSVPGVEHYRERIRERLSVG